MNTQIQNDAGLMTVLLQRYQNQRLPRALALKAKVDRGDTLDNFDTSFLMEVLDGVSEIKPILERHPECRKLATSMVSFCNVITEKGLQNEKAL